MVASSCCVRCWLLYLVRVIGVIWLVQPLSFDWLLVSMPEFICVVCAKLNHSVDWDKTLLVVSLSMLYSYLTAADDFCAIFTLKISNSRLAVKDFIRNRLCGQWTVAHIISWSWFVYRFDHAMPCSNCSMLIWLYALRLQLQLNLNQMAWPWSQSQIYSGQPYVYYCLIYL